ncbi:AlpA family phage regulatory protein [Sinorhizobium medicae]|nr:AlpA family phage regulatory protein [Sinorhizobium medicae]
MPIFEDRIGFYTMKDVCRITAMSRSTIYRFLEERRFPEPATFQDGGNLKFWIPDVHAWIRANLDRVAQAIASGRKRRGRKICTKRTILTNCEVGNEAASSAGTIASGSGSQARIDP